MVPGEREEHTRGVTRRRLATGLGLGLGVLYVLAGVAETARAVRSGDGGVPFWFGSLVGGGSLVLVGTFLRSRGSRAGGPVVVAGCLAGVLATAWTLVVPVLALVLVVLVVQETGPAAAPTPDVSED